MEVICRECGIKYEVEVELEEGEVLKDGEGNPIPPDADIWMCEDCAGSYIEEYGIESF